MAGTELTKLFTEAQKYLGLPYFCNRGRHRTFSTENALVGKGTAQEIALKTIELANASNLKLIDLSPTQIYRFQKKHHLGIDCSGLAVQLLNFYFGYHLNPRKISANMLTSPPLASPIPLAQIQPGDLIRQKQGRHVLFVLSVAKKLVTYIDSSLQGRGVHLSTFSLQKPTLVFDGIFRLTSPQLAPGT